MLEQSQKDSLTGFFLRGSLSPFLERLIIETNVHGKNFSIILVDLDRFKKFNDKFGHMVGDEILRYATSTLRLTFSEHQCHFFRYGGDEFIGVFPEKEPKEIAPLVRQCNYNLFHRPFLFKNKFYRFTISGGIAGFPFDGKTVDDLIQKADEALYFSKRHGRSMVTLASRIKYLKFMRIFIMIVSIIVTFSSLFILYKLTFKKIIAPTMSHLGGIKIVTPQPENLDVVILKSGASFEGRIVGETEDKLIINLYLDTGTGEMTFDKSEIANIQYGSKIPLQIDSKIPTTKAQ